jgi:arylsulfatase A-like enzyme
LPQHFRENGYATISTGKVFHHRTDCAERSWSEEPWRPSAPDGDWRNYLLEKNKPQPGSGRAGRPFECADVADDAYFDGQTAQRAMQQMGRLAAQDDPWFLAVGFLKPHLPFNAPKTYWDRYGEDDLRLADNPCAPENAPDQAMHNWGELRQYLGIPSEGPLSEELEVGMVHGYYAATSYTDAQVGRVLDELERLGLAGNTIVLLWGDHGWQLGEPSSIASPPRMARP